MLAERRQKDGRPAAAPKEIEAEAGKEAPKEAEAGGTEPEVDRAESRGRAGG